MKVAGEEYLCDILEQEQQNISKVSSQMTGWNICHLKETHFRLTTASLFPHQLKKITKEGEISICLLFSYDLILLRGSKKWGGKKRVITFHRQKGLNYPSLVWLLFIE